jgi:hypothetical protein
MAELTKKIQRVKMNRKGKYQEIINDQIHRFKAETPSLQLSGSKIIFHPTSRPKSSCKASVLSSLAFSSPVEYHHYSHIRPELMPKLFRTNKDLISTLHSNISKTFPQKNSFCPVRVVVSRCSSPKKNGKNHRARSKSRQRVYADQVEQLML